MFRSKLGAAALANLSQACLPFQQMTRAYPSLAATINAALRNSLPSNEAASSADTDPTTAGALESTGIGSSAAAASVASANANTAGSQYHSLASRHSKLTPANKIPRLNRHQPTVAQICTESCHQETRRDVREATSLHPSTYREEQLYEKEQEAVFRKSWFCVGFSNQISNNGDTIQTSVAGEPIIVTNQDNTIYAHYNVCRHRGSKIVLEDGNYKVFKCPYHRWGYSLDGRLQGTPLFKHTRGAETSQKLADIAVRKAFDTSHVKNFCKEDYSLLPVRVDTWGGLLFVNLSGDAPPLREYLGDVVPQLEQYPLDDLVTVRSATYESNCNWKLLIENFVEYYHLPAVHPQLCNVSGVDQHQRRQGAGMNTNFVTYPLTRGGTPIDSDKLPHFESLDEANRETAWFPMIFPNVFCFLFPHHMFTIVLHPESARKTRESAQMLVHPDLLLKYQGSADQQSLDAKLDAMFDFYDLTNRQDIEACELVQEGVMARAYQGGRLTFRFEEPVHRFQNMVIDYLTGQPRIPQGDATGAEA